MHWADLTMISSPTDGWGLSPHGPKMAAAALDLVSFQSKKPWRGEDSERELSLSTYILLSGLLPLLTFPFDTWGHMIV